MHIFCDESGGIENGIFVVCSVCIDPRDALHIISDMRKKFRLHDEIKGSSLSIEERAYFFEFLENKSDASSIAVKFAKGDPISSWSIHQLTPPSIYEYMLFESCSSHNYTGIKHANITPDGGKYSKKTMALIESGLQIKLASTVEASTKVKFADSQTSAGIQIADIISSTVYRAINSQLENLSVDPFCGRLVEQNRLIIQKLSLTGLTPLWLTQVAE